MNLQEHEVICSKCDGEAFVTFDGSIREVCHKCGGEGKVDWVSNAMQEASCLSTISQLHTTLSSLPSNDITFHFEGEDVIKLTKDSFYVKGKKIADDKKLYDAFVNFFRGVGTYI